MIYTNSDRYIYCIEKCGIFAWLNFPEIIDIHNQIN